MRHLCVFVGLIGPVGLFGLVPAEARAERCLLHVDAGALSKRLEALLATEVPDCRVVTSSRAATLSLTIQRLDGHLDVDMIAPPSMPVLARRIALDDADPEPALRRIALLAARAVESSRAIEHPETLEPERLWHFSLEAAFATQWWASPQRPQLGPALAVSVQRADFEAGVWAGLFCCNRDDAGIEAQATELTVLLRAGWRPLHLGPVALGLELAGGANAIRIRAAPAAFPVAPGQAEETRVRTAEGVVRFGGTFRATLVGETLTVFADGGGLLRFPAVTLTLPASDDEIRTGILVPWLEAGLAVRFF